jgi:hypothetical protein
MLTVCAFVPALWIVLLNATIELALLSLERPKNGREQAAADGMPPVVCSRPCLAVRVRMCIQHISARQDLAR